MNPVKDVLTTGPHFGSNGTLKGRLCPQTEWNSEEGEVVARMEAVPIGADKHGPGSFECVSFERTVGVDIVMQPPLHRHVPVSHSMSHFHTEVSVVAVNVLDGFEVINNRGIGIGAILHSRPPAGLGLGAFWVAAQACADAACFCTTPGRVEPHPEHEEHCRHVEQPEEEVMLEELLSAHVSQGEVGVDEQEEGRVQGHKLQAAQAGLTAGEQGGVRLLKPVHIGLVTKEWACHQSNVTVTVGNDIIKRRLLGKSSNHRGLGK